MEYKGYIAGIEYDDIEGLFYGHVVNSGTSFDCYLRRLRRGGVEARVPHID